MEVRIKSGNIESKMSGDFPSALIISFFFVAKGCNQTKALIKFCQRLSKHSFGKNCFAFIKNGDKFVLMGANPVHPQIG